MENKRRKLDVFELAIEITRCCNMTCEHCLRGDAQNINIKNEYIDDVLKHIDYIETLNITGGEPSLNVPAIEFIYESIVKYNITVLRFSIPTNGSINSISERFIDICAKLHDIQKDKQSKLLIVSADRYHDKKHFNEVQQKISTLRFGKTLPEGLMLLLKQGRSQNGNGVPRKTLRCLRGYRIADTLCLNAKGYILDCCNFDYDNQEIYKLCGSKNLLEYLNSINEPNSYYY